MKAHPSDLELRVFVSHRLNGDRVIAIDDHLAACESCRGRASAIGRAPARLVDLTTDVLALDAHLSEDDIQRFVSGELSSDERARLARHVADCETCGRDVEDLRRWAVTRSPRRPRIYVAAAAAIVLLALTPFAIVRWLSDPPSGDASIAGLELLPADQQSRVTAAVRAGVAGLPSAATEMMKGADVLMGAAGAQPFRLTAPLMTITVSNQPAFRWDAVPGVDDYTVAVLHADLTPVAGPVTVTDATWTPSQPLARDREYVWQVTARRGATSVTVPAPPAPLARFRVMDEMTAEAIDRVLREQPAAHLLLGIMLVQAGARQEAEAHLRQVGGGDAHADVARRTLEQLDRVR